LFHRVDVSVTLGFNVSTDASLECARGVRIGVMS
jgi:hypothetical protein